MVKCYRLPSASLFYSSQKPFTFMPQHLLVMNTCTSYNNITVSFSVQANPQHCLSFLTAAILHNTIANLPGTVESSCTSIYIPHNWVSFRVSSFEKKQRFCTLV